MKIFDVVIQIIVEHPIFGISLAFLLGTLIFALFEMTGWAIACFVVAVIIAGICFTLKLEIKQLPIHPNDDYRSR